MFGCVEIGSEVWFTPKVCKTTSQIPNYIQVWLKNWHHKHKETRLKRLLLQYQGKRTLFLCLFFIGSNLLQRFPKILHFGCVPESCLLPEMIVAPESFAHSRKSAPEISSYRLHVCSMIFVPVQSFSDQPSITARPCCCTCCRSPVAKPWVLHAMAAGALDLVLK